MNRKLLWAVFVIGLALVIAPFALSLPSKASAGERMLNSFEPIMQPNQVRTTAYFYNDVFVPLGQVTPMLSARNVAKFQAYMKGFAGTRADAAKLIPILAQALHMTPAQVQALMRAQLPAMAGMLQNLPAMQRDFGGLMGTMQQNVGIFSIKGQTNLEFAIELEADRLLTSFIRREDLVKEMTVVRNEFEIGENNPRGILNQRMMAIAFERQHRIDHMLASACSRIRLGSNCSTCSAGERRACTS